MYKSILWDNDGVLVDTEKWYFQATKEIMKEEGFELSLEIYRDTFYQGYEKKTILPAWLITFVLAILSYLVVLYYLAAPKIMY